MKSKFYRVTCKCGHVGKRHFIRIDFPVNADSGKEASRVARSIPRVKHEYKDAILSCIEIDYEEYLIIQKINDHDAYLKCKNRQQQRNIADFALRLELESSYTLIKKIKRQSVEYKLRKQTEVEREVNSYYMDGDFNELLVC